jgi:hypothetical protein
MEEAEARDDLPLGEREFEVWAEDNYPPYILLVTRTEGEEPVFKITDPRDKNKELFSSRDYMKIVHWLREDEFSRVEGETKILEWWEP